MAKVPLRIVYDGECPFCSSYVALLRLREKYDVRLVDARKKPAFAAQYGLDLNEGMIADLDGQVHHGARAMSLLSRLSGTISPLRSDRIADAVYPLFRFGRNVALKVLGRSQI